MARNVLSAGPRCVVTRSPLSLRVQSVPSTPYSHSRRSWLPNGPAWPDPRAQPVVRGLASGGWNWPHHVELHLWVEGHTAVPHVDEIAVERAAAIGEHELAGGLVRFGCHGIVRRRLGMPYPGLDQVAVVADGLFIGVGLAVIREFAVDRAPVV